MNTVVALSCSVDGCHTERRARGLCKRHYSQLIQRDGGRRTPTPDAPPAPPQGRGVLTCQLCDQPYTEHPWPPAPCQQKQRR